MSTTPRAVLREVRQEMKIDEVRDKLVLRFWCWLQAVCLFSAERSFA